MLNRLLIHRCCLDTSSLFHYLLQLLLEATVKGIPQKVLGSAAYQVANMDVLNVSAFLALIVKPC